MSAIRLMMADELRNERVLATVCGKDSHNNNEMDVSHVNSYPLQLPTYINYGFAQLPVTISSCEPPLDDNSLQTVSSDSLP